MVMPFAGIARVCATTLQLRPVALAFAIAVGLSGAAAASSTAEASTPAPVVFPSIANPELWPKASSPIARDEALEARIAALLATLTVEEKVGQIVQGDLGSLTPDDVRKYRLGSVLAGGNSDPGAKYNASAAEWLALADALYLASMDTSGGGKALPVLLGIDAVHGHNNVVGATLFPHNIALGASNDADLLRNIAIATAAELRTTGFEWTFAPTVTVPRDDRWGRTYEGYSEDPGLVSRYATAVVEGLQGKVGAGDFLDATHVVASSKHFIGDGGTSGGKDKGDTQVSEIELRDVHGAGHIAALKAGTQTVMASFSSWNGQKMHGNASLLTGVLKQRLGFDGFVVGDWNGHGEVPGCSNDSCPAAINAGLDMFMAPDTWRAVYTNTVAQVRAGEIPMARLDDAVTRILRVKFRLGLFDAGLPSKRALGGKFDQLASTAHRKLARAAVRQSLVLLKNDTGLLPLDPKASVLVAGDGADDVGKQSGGWTLSWQGTGNKPSDFPNAQSIWAGISEATAAAGGNAVLSADGQFTTRPDVAIVVFGENPYAEFLGDIANLAYQPGATRDLDLLRKLKAAGIPVVAVFLSGRPLWVNREINASDAFVAAWLPGSEGGGVADVLFKPAQGQPAHDFTGTLPFSWPRTAAQTPLNAGQENYGPQFPLGYGLNYAKPGKVGVLPEESGLKDGGGKPGVYFANGALSPGWSMRLAEGDSAGDAVTSLPASSTTGALAVGAADHLAQEDARRLRWTGATSAALLLHTGTPLDLSREANAGAQLVLTLRVDAKPAGDVKMGLRSGAHGRGSISLAKLINDLPAGTTWTRIGVPLACFQRAGADLTQVSDVFELSSSHAMGVSISRVALGNEADHSANCNAP
ncbi:MAG: 1,4-beta-D-glucan glucohydrolase [Gammaproteobacteria bacterium RIFCSPHIGHO2_12_FULL_63_22]|nr:MAG: 1,4-beta-D-glucan glucohydrolase [Gammaproteobacteria bacterium RIFCSPHIGHO2_12_FULL_63_22]